MWMGWCVVIYNEEFSLTKSNDLSITCFVRSYDKLDTLYVYLYWISDHQTRQCGDLS